MRDLYMDHETNGLLKELKVIHCLGVIDIRTDEEFYFGPAVPEDHPKWTPLLGNPTGTVEEGVKFCELPGQTHLLIAHNGIDFDYRAMDMLYPGWKRPRKAWDSFVTAKVVWPYDTLMGPDMKRAKLPAGSPGWMPMQMVKRHSLKAWGYRLGENKDDYDGDRTKFPEPSDRPAKAGDERYDRRWEEWNPWLASYMMQDCRPGVKLWRLIEERIGWTDKLTAVTWPEQTIEVENEVARILAQQEWDGVYFNIAKAEKLSAELSNEQGRISSSLVDTFQPWWQPGKVVTPKADRNVKRTEFPDVTTPRYGKNGQALAPYVGPPVEGYSTDAPYTPVVWTPFNPSSRDHLGQRLQAVFGWKPKKYGANGKPTVDETVLEEIPEAVIPKETRQLIMDYFVVSKTLGTLTKGRKSWLNLVDPKTSKIHGRMDPAGAITGRGTHKDPNLSGTPSVLKEKVTLPDGTKTEVVVKGLKGRYGWECRELFCADPGWEQTGVDAASLELIDLGHYMWPHDDGLFSRRVCDPTRDAHQENANIADMTRGDAKTAIYLFVYGGGAYKLSLSLSVVFPEELHYLSYRGLPMLLRNLVKRFDQDFVDKLDDMQKARIAKARTIIVKFEKNIDGLRELIDLVTETGARGWLKGLDGRKVIVRKAYSSLNTLLQSAGAQTCKLWMMLVDRELRRRGLVWGVDYRQVLWVHDELQFVHRPGLGPIIAEVALAAIKEAGVILGLRGEYRGEAKLGLDWAECH